MFLSSKSSVDSGAHSATDSLHRIDWSTERKPCQGAKIVDVVGSPSFTLLVIVKAFLYDL